MLLSWLIRGLRTEQTTPVNWSLGHTSDLEHPMYIQFCLWESSIAQVWP